MSIVDCLYFNQEKSCNNMDLWAISNNKEIRIAEDWRNKHTSCLQARIRIGSCLISRWASFISNRISLWQEWLSIWNNKTTKLKKSSLPLFSTRSHDKSRKYFEWMITQHCCSRRTPRMHSLWKDHFQRLSIEMG